MASEAIDKRCSCVVAYHPIIFRGLKALTSADPQQASLLRLASEGISVYCPHTAVDAVEGGMADWLADVVTGKYYIKFLTGIGDTDDEAAMDKGSRWQYSPPTYPRHRETASFSEPGSLNIVPHQRQVIVPASDKAISATDDPSQHSPSTTGAGRLVTFNEPQHLSSLIQHIADGTGLPKGFAVATPQSGKPEDIYIRTVGVCPGSGGSILGSCGADLIFTGELGHHEALAVTERGGCVVTLFHSNSERGFLRTVMKNKMEETLWNEWEAVRKEFSAGHWQSSSGAGGRLDAKELQEAFADESVKVEVSTVDRDPFGLVLRQDDEEGST